MVFPELYFQNFTDMEKGLGLRETNYPASGADKVILFFDINLPILSGWDILEKFIQFPDPIKTLFRIYILSSSVAKEYLQKAQASSYISDFIEKPLVIAQLQTIMRDI